MPFYGWITCGRPSRSYNATKHPVLRYCGDADSPEWMIPKVLWIKENQKDIYKRSYKIIEQLDYLNL